MTEIPEHLLKRSAARRGGGGGGDDSAPSPEAAGGAVAKASAAPAKKAAPAPEKVEKAPEPVPPYVEASLKRKRIPLWAMPVLALLPVWAIIYVVTLTPAGEKKPTQLELGATVYTSRCASCHGADGSGGAGRVFKGGELIKTFPKIDQQLEFVWLGSTGTGPEGTPYGDPEREEGQHKTLSFNGTPMPGFKGVLTEEELLAVVRYERETISGEKVDAKQIDADENRTHDNGAPLIDDDGATLLGADGKPLFDADGKLAADS